MLNHVRKTAQKCARILLSHHSLYGGLSGSHLWGALLTGKPEVYLPMAVLYLVLAVKG